MSLFKHRGGSLAIPGTDIVIYYGPGLNKKCPTCKVDPNVRCISTAGRLYKKTHPARLI